MKRTALIIFFFISAVLINAQSISIPGHGFENDELRLKTWQPSKPSLLVSIDNSTAHSGGSSLRMENQQASSSSVISQELRLETGKLYRLSAWVKTENARTDQYAQYPTPVAACITMQSFPFTNHSPATGGTSQGWQKTEVLFIATQKTDRISLTLGYNGQAQGKAWFDDVSLEEVKDISEYIPMETVRWHNNAFRFEDKGWIFVHIEGEPYSRGFDYGYLLAGEIAEFITKLGTGKNNSNPKAGWNEIRFAADALMLRKYDEEYLTEMKGIADGIKNAGVSIFDRQADLIDIVAANSAIDISYCEDALHVTPTPLTGKSFLAAEDELALHDKLHKCSSFLATKSASKDKRIVFGQLFMWGGYTGNNWNVIVDVQPSKGNRLVYETFPGGIHSGADFYINGSGIMIGETTVNQGPFNPDGTPQSNRIRKAAQYANSIDDVVSILTTKNNGLYTNDWLIGDTKTDEVAILVLGTIRHKLWRSSENDFYGGQKDWYWSVNNNKSEDVRKEYITNDNDAPYDIIFRPVNRDLEFRKFYESNHGSIDAVSGIKLLATSPINRPHACDGKVTTSEMAERLMFFANFGKVTLREKFVGENGRIPDLPGAAPHFSLGYSVISPVLFTEGLKSLRSKAAAKEEKQEKKLIADEVESHYSFDREKLWKYTVYPASEAENWFVSATAAYWNMLASMPSSPSKRISYLSDELSELNSRLLYTTAREGAVVPVKAATQYDRYNNYQIPRIRGTYLLHQLRLKLGNEQFSRLMTKFHNDFKEKEFKNSDFIRYIKETAVLEDDAFIKQWIEREDIPELSFEAASEKSGGNWLIKAIARQGNNPYNILVSVMIETEKEQIWKAVEVDGSESSFTFEVKDKPLRIVFNAGGDIPSVKENYFTFSNFTDDFSRTLIVYGTSRQIEANHTLALRFQKMAADRFTETLLPVRKDSETGTDELSGNDLVILGSPADNQLMKAVLEKLNISCDKNMFRWNGKVYGSADDGLFAAYPNPYNPSRTVYIFLGNSAMQLYNMTKILNRMPSWALFRKDQMVEKGYFSPSNYEVRF